MKQTVFTFLVFVFLSLSGCSSPTADQKQSDCPIPPPEAIFKKKLDAIVSQSFSLNGRNSEEILKLADGTEVTIFQSGCDKIAQEFRFRLQGRSERNKASLAIEQMMGLANLDAEYMTFANWAKAIKALESEFSKNDSVEVDKGFFVALDKVNSAQHTTLIIKLFQQ